MAKKTVEKKQKINVESAAYILGIVSIVNAIFSPLMGVVFGIIGLVLSSKQKTLLSKRGKHLSLAGIIVGLVLFILMLILSALVPQAATAAFLG